MLIIDNEQILQIGVHSPRRPRGKSPFVLVHVSDEVMETISHADCHDVELPSGIQIPQDAEVALRNVTGYEYAPSTDEHWGVHVGNNRVEILMRNQIL